MSTVSELNKWVDLAKNLLEAMHTDAEIEQTLRKKGIEEDALQIVLKQITVIRIQKRRSMGLQLIIVGAILLGLSFLLTVCFYHSGGDFTWVMYGGTSLGLILIFVGLYFAVDK